MSRAARLTNGLRAVRALQARATGALVAAVPALEPIFIRMGRAMARRSRLIGTLYWFAEEDLVGRLRRSRRRFRSMSIAGTDVFVDVTDGTARLHYFHGEPYEPELVEALPRLVKPGSVFIDVGANIGFFTVLAARLAGAGGLVVAFEPHPGAREILHAAVAINALRNVEIVGAALGAREGAAVALHLTGDSVLSSTDPARAPLRDDFPFTGRIDVPLHTLDGWLRGRPELRPRITGIKIDVEGTEADVLAGMIETIDACPSAAIVCETDAAGAADTWLRARGYRPAVLDVRQGVFGNYLYTR